MTTDCKPRVLCVDDEPNILSGLTRQLGPHFAVTTAPGGAEGLQVLERQGPFAVVVSDLRMPQMDGIGFLRQVRAAAPETVRVLLTGQADLVAAIAAVNEGAIFRFLTKPCPPVVLLQALEAAAEQHRLVTAERILLKETLQGSIRMLLEILTLANPAAFGRATRAKTYATALVTSLGITDRWPLEIAAMLSQIGSVTLPDETVEKLYQGRQLSASEQAMVARLPEVAGKLLGNIPRLEPVQDILTYQGKHFDGSGLPARIVRGEGIPLGARILKVVLDFDELKTQGVATREAFDTMRRRDGWYDRAMLEEFAKLHARRSWCGEEQVLRLGEVQEGMVFADEVRTRSGVLLIARGHEVTPTLLEKIRNLSPGIGVQEPIRVIVSRPAPAKERAR